LQVTREQERDKLQSQLNQLTTQLKDLQKATESRQSESKQHLHELEQAQARIADLEKELDTSQSTVNQHMDKLKELELLVQSSQDAVKEWQAKHEASAEQAKQQDELQSVLEKLKRSLEDEQRLGKEERIRLEEEFRVKEANLKAVNKTLKEEVRKLQKQAQPVESKEVPSSPSVMIGGRMPIHHPGAPVQKPLETMNEDDINMEYVKQIIMQFVERPNVRVRSETVSQLT